MKIDLCKLLGVGEGEEFIVEFKDGHTTDCKYRVMNNLMEWSEIGTKYDGDYHPTCFSLNDANKVKNIIKLPKKKEFTDDELAIMRSIEINYKWIVRNRNGRLFLHKDKPEKYINGAWDSRSWCGMQVFNHLFNSIKWEDEEPVFIDDYVER